MRGLVVAMKLPEEIVVYGDITYRGDCHAEVVEQVTIFNRLKAQYPDTLAKIAVHIRNEGRRTHDAARREKAEGLTPGASDIIIPGNPSFVCELKRRDHTKCKLSEEQLKYLLAAQRQGAFVCIALGADGAMLAIKTWLRQSGRE